MSSKPRIAWFSPLSLENSSSLDGSLSSPSAYVSEQLLPILAKDFDIELFVDDFSPRQGFKTFHYLSAVTRHATEPYDLFFYQFEDSKVGAFVRLHLGLIPGLVLFHDLLITQDGPEPILNSPWERGVQMVLTGKREWPNRLDEFSRERPFAVREVGYAAVPAFSCPRMHQEYKTQRTRRTRLSEMTGDLSFYLPFPVNAQDLPFPRNFTVGFAGSPRIEHRSHKILNALANLKTSASLVWLIDAAEEAQAQSLLEEFGVKNFVLKLNRSPRVWSDLQGEISVAIHPLFSVFGQTDPYLKISMAAGRPCITSDFGASEYLPNGTVFKVRPGETEAFEISAIIERIRNSDLSHWGAAGQRWATEESSKQKVAKELASIFRESIAAIRPVMQSWQKLQHDAAQELVRESQALLDPTSWATIADPVFKELNWNE